ncbi:MAG: DAK2 domain-containing protein [Bacillota bacterium]
MQLDNNRPAKQSKQQLNKLDLVTFKAALIHSSNYFAEFKEEINQLNVFPVPDGDTGTNMYLTLSQAREAIEDQEVESISELTAEFANGALLGARGNSGVIFSQLLRGFAEGVNSQQQIGVSELAQGLERAVEVAYQGVMKPIEGTILTVAKEVGSVAKSVADEELEITDFLAIVVKQAATTVEETPEYLTPLQEAGVVDAGGRGYEVFLRGLYHYLADTDDSVDNEKSRTVDYIESEGNNQVKEVNFTSTFDQHNLEDHYCTEFKVYQPQTSLEKLQAELDEQGDSLLVIEGEDYIKVHLHTNHPGLVIEEALAVGTLADIKIDNLALQQKQNSQEQENNERSSALDERLGVIAVANGAGLRDSFRSLGVDRVVTGGQSMNPSIQDLLTAVEEAKAQQLIILPNNPNIISTAQQVQKLTDKEIAVVETTSVPEGLTAMMMFTPTGELSRVVELMTEESNEVKSGAVTYAVCDSKVDGLTIDEDDLLGLIEGEIEVTGKDRLAVVEELVRKLVTEDDYLVSIYYGAEVTAAEVKQLEERLAANIEDIEWEFNEGGQTVYYYLIAVE